MKFRMLIRSNKPRKNSVEDFLRNKVTTNTFFKYIFKPFIKAENKFDMVNFPKVKRRFS